jgi:glycosyltransferase involved in cell wall biosynthesis
MLTTFFPPFNFGGDGIMVERLSRALVRRGHEVTVVHDPDAWRLLSGAGDPPRPARPPGLQVVELDGGLGRLGLLLAHQLGRPVAHARRLRQLLDGGDFDVIHFHNVSLLGGPGIFAAGDALKLYTAHDHWLVCPTHVLWRHDREACTGRQCLRCVLHYRRPPQAWRATGLLDRQLEHVDAFLALSDFSRRKHAEFGFTRPMDVLPCFAEAPPVATPAAQVHERPYVLFVGRLEPLKGLDGVIPQLERYPDADLLVAGEGRHGDALRALARGSRRIRFLGRLTQEELDPLYAHAVAVLVPSVGFETFSLVILEAFRHGTPVVARNLGPFPEIIGASGGGVLFDSDAELPAVLADVQRTPGRRAELSRRARQAAETLWSEETVLAGYLAVVRREAARLGRARILERLPASAPLSAPGR